MSTSPSSLAACAGALAQRGSPSAGLADAADFAAFAGDLGRMVALKRDVASTTRPELSAVERYDGALDAFERDERAMCRRGLWLEKGDVARKAVVKVFALGAGARVDGGQRTKSIASAIDPRAPHARRRARCSARKIVGVPRRGVLDPRH